MLNREMLLAREKPLSLTIITTGVPAYLTIKFLPGNKIETDVWEFPTVYSKSTLEGQTKIELSCGITRSFYDYSISGQGVSIDYFDYMDTMIRFNLSPSGVDATITLDIDIGSG